VAAYDQGDYGVKFNWFEVTTATPVVMKKLSLGTNAAFYLDHITGVIDGAQNMYFVTGKALLSLTFRWGKCCLH